MLLEGGDVRRFPDAADLAGCAGKSPSQRRSDRCAGNEG